MVAQQVSALPLDSFRSKLALSRLEFKMWGTSGKTDRAYAQEAAQSASLRTGEAIDAKAFSARRELWPADVIKPAISFRTACKAEWYSLTAPWQDDGWRVMKAATVIRLTQRYAEWERTWNQEIVPSLVAAYPAAINAQRQKQGIFFDPNAYPSVTRIQDYFRLTHRVQQLPSVADFRLDGLSDADIAQVQAQTEAALKAALADAQRDAWEQLAACLDEFVVKLGAYDPDSGHKGAFHGSLVTNLADLLDRLPALNITDDPNLTALVTLARTDLTRYDAKELKADEQAREDTKQKAADIRAVMDSWL